MNNCTNTLCEHYRLGDVACTLGVPCSYRLAFARKAPVEKKDKAPELQDNRVVFTHENIAAPAMHVAKDRTADMCDGCGFSNFGNGGMCAFYDACRQLLKANAR